MDGSNPDVSVVMPAFNVSRYIERAIRSALDQEGVSVEVVVVDDASSDNTAAVVERLAVGEPRLRLIRNKHNLGCGGSRNVGADAAQGTWIALLDADDAFKPGRLARLLAVAEDASLDAISDLPIFHDLAAGLDAPDQLDVDGSLEQLDLIRYVRAAVSADSKLDYGLLKPVFRRQLVVDGLWRYPQKSRHGADFFGNFNVLAAQIPFGVLHEAHYVFSTRIGAHTRTFSPGSVTPVNYRNIARDTAELIGHVQANGLGPSDDHRTAILSMLQERIDKCHDLNRRYGWTTLRRGAWERLATWLRQDRRNAALLATTAIDAAASGRWLKRWLAPRRS